VTPVRFGCCALDELEASPHPILRSCFYGAMLRSAGLAEMGVVYLTASKRGLYALDLPCTSAPCLPLFTSFRSSVWALMPDDEARGLLTALSNRDRGRLCEEEIDLGLELAGPHPFFLQIAGFHLYDMPGRGPRIVLCL